MAEEGRRVRKWAARATIAGMIGVREKTDREADGGRLEALLP